MIMGSWKSSTQFSLKFSTFFTIIGSDTNTIFNMCTLMLERLHPESFTRKILRIITETEKLCSQNPVRSYKSCRAFFIDFYFGFFKNPNLHSHNFQNMIFKILYYFLKQFHGYRWNSRHSAHRVRRILTWFIRNPRPNFQTMWLNPTEFYADVL